MPTTGCTISLETRAAASIAVVSNFRFPNRYVEPVVVMVLEQFSPIPVTPAVARAKQEMNNEG